MISAWPDGDLGYEIRVKPEYQCYLLDLLLDAGWEFNIRLFGLRALNALRLEKNYGGWAREYRPLYFPDECELGRFVALDKESEFIGKGATDENRHSGGGPMRLRSFVVDATNSDVIGDEPILYKEEVRGWVTSGGYAHAANVSMAMGFVPRNIAEEQSGWQIELQGDLLPARLQRDALFDVNGRCMRS